MNRHLLIVLVASVVACRCGEEKKVAVAPAAPAAWSEATLSLLVPERGGCGWFRRDPLTKREERLGSFDVDCEGAHVAWSHDRKRAMVVLRRDVPPPEGSSPDNDAVTEPSIHVLELGTDKVTKLPPPSPGVVEDFGFDPQGTPKLLTLHLFETADGDAPAALEFGGKKYPIPEGAEGIPALAHAFTPDTAGGWTLEETALTSEGWDYAAGVSALETAKTLGPRTKAMYEAPTEGTTVEDATLVSKLAAIAPETASEEGEWRKLPTTAGEAYVWMTNGEFLSATARVVFVKGGTAIPASNPALEPGEASAVFARGPWVMVAGTRGEQVRIYDARSGALMASLDDVDDAAFWPN